MPLQCPKCQSNILAQQINQEFQATCPQCKTIFDAADQLADLLAYQHPKKIEPTPANLDETYTDGVLEITLGRFRKRWLRRLAWRAVFLIPILLISLTFIIPDGVSSRIKDSISSTFCLFWILSFLLVTGIQNTRRIIITITDSYLTVSISDIRFNKQFAIHDIKQLYLKELSYSYPIFGGTRTYYQLRALLKQGQAEPLTAELKDWPTALYLEQRLEAALKLKDQPVEGELDYLPADEQRRLLKWGTLAERLNLAFIPGSGKRYYEGHYPKLDLTFAARPDGDGHQEAQYSQSFLFRLDAFYQRHEGKFIKYTRLRLTKTNLAPAQLSAEEEAELKSRVAVDEPVDLLAPPEAPKELKGTLEIRSEEGMVYYEQVGIEADLAYLEKLFELMAHIAGVYPKILAWGGAAVPALQTVATQMPSLKSVARQLLQNIAAETQTRLGKQAGQLLCPACLEACTTHKIWLPPGEPLTYYGCRACRQSREFLAVKGSIVAVLDEQMAQPYHLQEENLYINWLRYRHPFDFDKVHIRQTTDQKVERFAIQAGNDTDSVRRPRYARMLCLVWPEAGLSENSMKILKRTFGRVEVRTQDRPKLQEKVKTSGPRVSRLDSETEEKTARDAQET